MKRFFCTICNRVKRVRNLPNNPAQCNFHNSNDSRTVINRRVRLMKSIYRPKSAPTPPKPSKKRG